MNLCVVEVVCIFQVSPIQLSTLWRLAVQENGRCTSHESVWLFDEEWV
jgi:hypothetical protein